MNNPWDTSNLLHVWNLLERYPSEDYEFEEGELPVFSANPVRHCMSITRRVVTGSYHPAPCRIVAVPRFDGAQQFLMMPRLADWILQSSFATWVREFPDATLSKRGFSPGLRFTSSTTTPLIREHLKDGFGWVTKLDICVRYDRVEQVSIINNLKQRPWWGGRAAWLMLGWLRYEIEPSEMARADGPVCKCRGLPQGLPLTPTISFILLNSVDVALERLGIEFVRHIDSILMFAKSREEAVGYLDVIGQLLLEEKLSMYSDSSSIYEVAQGFSFRGSVYGVDDANSRENPMRPDNTGH